MRASRRRWVQRLLGRRSFPVREVPRIPSASIVLLVREPNLSPFGQQLRHWRTRSGMSQLTLSSLAGTTPRHLSFVETGRSRPGSDLVLRLATALDVPVRERNALLVAAGLPAT